MALDDAPIDFIQDEQLVPPNGQPGNGAKWQFGVREPAALALAIHVPVTAEFTHQLACIAADYLNAVFPCRVQVALAIQRLVKPGGSAYTWRIREVRPSRITIPPPGTERLATGWRE